MLHAGQTVRPRKGPPEGPITKHLSIWHNVFARDYARSRRSGNLALRYVDTTSDTVSLVCSASIIMQGLLPFGCR